MTKPSRKPHKQLKQLILLRHAKSSWKAAEQTDFDRPLNGRGRRTAPLIGAWLAAHGFAPDLVLASSAKRTHETVARLGPVIERARIVEDEALYLAEPATILARIAAVPAATERLLVVGHNPGLELLAVRLTPPGEAARDAMAQKFPTGALAWFSVAARSWRDIAGTTALLHFVTPAELDG